MSESAPRDGRVPRDLILSQAHKLAEWSEIRGLFDAIPDILLAVNSSRQIVYANQTAVDYFHIRSASHLWGRRPGEVAECIHSREAPGGCGNAESCRVCGAFLAITRGLEGESPVEECRMMLQDGTARDLRIWVRPFQIDKEPFLFLSIQDISDEKRRKILEKLFFHDLLNTAGGLRSLSEILGHSAPEELGELHDILASLSDQLVDEIQSHRDLLSAERGELHPQFRPANSREIVAKTIAMYLKNQACDGKTIQSAAVCEEIPLSTDSALLLRVLGNLAKNALEASSPGGTVTIGCHAPSPQTVEFFVHNEACMPMDTQHQIFKRSFSTKGSGRGLGTYSVRLLTERFLGGRTDFTSTPGEGTIFSVRLPKTACPPTDPSVRESGPGVQSSVTGARQVKFSHS
ncbi:MAG: PAS domain-containing protein [Chthoniobacterales bacterium]|nr:PAS domain-containing protein [Chthoniobacterales bacterium]